MLLYPYSHLPYDPRPSCASPHGASASGSGFGITYFNPSTTDDATGHGTGHRAIALPPSTALGGLGPSQCASPFFTHARVVEGTRTRTNTQPYDKEPSAADRVVRACVARESKHKRGWKAGAVIAGTRLGRCSRWVGRLTCCTPRGVSEAPLGLFFRSAELGCKNLASRRRKEFVECCCYG